MAGISNVTQAAILKLVFNATNWSLYADNTATTPQTNIAVALHTADPTNAGNMSSSEVAYTSYARASVARTSGGWNVTGTSPTQAALVATLSFPAGTGGSGTVTNFSTGATVGGATAAILWSGTVSPNITTGNGITPQLTTSTVCTLD